MELVFEQKISAPLERVFAFHENPGNLLRLLRGWPRFRLLHYEPALRLGGRMWIEESFWGIPVALGFIHHCYEPPYRMGSRLFHGPFQRFTHDYQFAPIGADTSMRITLEVAVPRQFGGAWMLTKFVAPLLRKAFTLRQRELERLALAGEL